MLEPETGALILATSGVRFDSRLTKSAFLRLPIAAHAAPGTINDPWANYTLVLAPYEVGPFPADLTLQFHGERLVWLVLLNTSTRFGEGWEDWSEAKEMEREAAHRAWLVASGLPPRRYRFGEVWSGYSSKDALSQIVIRYGESPHG